MSSDLFVGLLNEIRGNTDLKYIEWIGKTFGVKP
jgi:hypothetical protein